MRMFAADRRRLGAERGVSLFEMMIAVALMALVGGLAIGVARDVEPAKLRQAAAEIGELAARARAHAQSSGAAARLYYDPARRRFIAGAFDWAPPEELSPRFEAGPLDLAMAPTGRSAGANFRIEGAAHALEVWIDPFTGRVSTDIARRERW